MNLGQRFGWLMGLGALHLAACGSVTEHHGMAAAGSSAGGTVQATAGTGGVGTVGGVGGSGPNICPLKCGTTTVCYQAPDRFLDCPKDYASYKPDCDVYGGVDVVEYDSSCGGKVIEASDGIQTEWWSFSANGELVGTQWAGDVGDSGCWGEPCKQVGKGRTICQRGEPGGAANEGGASTGGAAGNDAGGAP